MQKITIQNIIDQLQPSCFDEAGCRQLILGLLHPEGARCPSCRQPVDAAQSAAFWSGGRLTCIACKIGFTARSKTIIDKAGLGYSDIFRFAIFGSIDFAPAEIADRLGLHRNTINNWRKRLDA